MLEKLNLTADVLDGIREHRIDGNPKTLEGKVVGYADRIAYVNHDIDDGIRAGLIAEESLPEECISVLGRTHRDRINNLVYNLVENSAGKPYITLSDEFERALEELNSIGVVRINIMVDSDYQVKEEVRKARDRYIEMGVAAGFEVAPITWTQKQKGVDDLYKHLFRNK